MRTYNIIFVAAILMLVLFRAVRNRYRTDEKTFKTTDEFIHYLSTEAVADAQRENHIELDYSVESIEKVEMILGKLHEQYEKDQASVSAVGLGSAYGGYIGEVIRRSEPGSRWEQDHPVVGEKTYPLHWGEGESFPIAWCIKRIKNGSDDNVWHKYLILKDRRSQVQKDTPVVQ